MHILFDGTMNADLHGTRRSRLRLNADHTRMEKAKPPTDPIRQTLDEVYRTESRRVLATLIRLLGDFDIAEEAMHEAFAVALEQWQRGGVPANPRGWLISTGRFKAIDALRRQAKTVLSDSNA